MEVILLLIYSFFVWLIFIKLRWLPWTIVSQVIAATIPVIGLAVLILLLNIYAPSTSDVRVINYVVQVVPRVTGRVIEVPVEPNRPVKKGDVLFRIDPVPFQQQVAALEARIPELQAKIINAQAYQRELEDQLVSAAARRAAIGAKLDLARKRLDQTRELAEAGAGPRFDFEQAEADARNLEAELAAAAAEESRVRQKLSARTDAGELAEVAQAKAALDQARAQLGESRWQLEQTTVYAPADGTVVNLQLRVGSYAASLPMVPVMSFVEREQWLIALYRQNELRWIEPDNEAEVALKTYPNRIIKCKVDSIVWASGIGQLPIGGVVPQTGSEPTSHGRIAVRLMPEGRDRDLFLAAGAQGSGAVYTNSGKMIHIVRKVFLRVQTKLDWVVPKLH